MPDWFPVDKDLVVVESGVVEIVLGAALLAVLLPALARCQRREGTVLVPRIRRGNHECQHEMSHREGCARAVRGRL
ncbi:MAG TPA: hypothetical protein VGA13_12565 [Acidimicrobiales bacterium]